MTNERNPFLPLNLQLFAEDLPQDPPADDKKMDDNPPPKTYTQDEIDRIVADRLGRERKKYADYDDIKAERERLKQAEEERKKADMTEKERLEAEKAEALKKAEEAEAKREQALSNANQR